jgi:hypothetical protein
VQTPLPLPPVYRLPCFLYLPKWECIVSCAKIVGISTFIGKAVLVNTLKYSEIIYQKDFEIWKFGNEPMDVAI